MQPELRYVQRLSASLRVPPGSRIDVTEVSTTRVRRMPTKADAAMRLNEGIALLIDYQDRLWAQATTGVLLVIQGIDASGKDGTIRHVMSGMNPQGVEVHSFKEPSADELAHDMLWRYHADIPGKGRIGIFNRSYYEEVLVVRVHPQLLTSQQLPGKDEPEALWRRRYREINDFERYLTDNGIRVVKVFLHLSRREQARRFLQRIDEPRKHWKFSVSDLRERRHWDAYQDAFSQMLTKTSTPWAPWHVVPADHKWFARLATAATLIDALAVLDPQYPAPAAQARDEMARAAAELRRQLGARR
jgi:PPK2 family polyphosphate:nucleotide phosphotransferase